MRHVPIDEAPSPPLAIRRWMAVLWPAFLGAGALCGIVFSVVDPHDLSWFGRPVELSRLAVYTLGFFVFWMVTAAVGFAVTVVLDPTDR
jgi:hypothetical protein